MIDINDVDRLGRLKEDENYRFRRFLKGHADADTLDRQFKRLHDKYSKMYDCSKCRNCCKKLGASFSEDEVKKICLMLDIDEKEFKENELNFEYTEYTTKRKPCLFLGNDGKCKINGFPLTCKNYPYTDQPERLDSLLGVVSNSFVCPIVYSILEDLKREYNFKVR